MKTVNSQPINNNQSYTKDISAARLVVLGAICGDIIGSRYEFCSTKRYDFVMFNHRNRFTDDTVCTIGIADALVHGNQFGESLQYWCHKYPRAGYAGMFLNWIFNDMNPYNSWGNGSAMRVSPVGAYARTHDEAMDLAKKSAEITHNHPEGIKGAQATAAAIHYALTGRSKEEIRTMIETTFGYNLSRSYNDIHPYYRFDVSCQGSVPESIIAFLDSTDYESSIRKAVALGGDADTMAAITGGIAAAYYRYIPDHILSECTERLPQELLNVITEFNATIN